MVYQEQQSSAGLIQRNDRVIGIFWRDWKRDKRMEMKQTKRKLFIQKLKTSKRFKIKQRNKK